MDLPETALAILPELSRQKYERMRTDRELAGSAMHAASDAKMAAMREHQLLASRVREQLQNFGGYEILPPGAAFKRGAVEQAKSETEERLMAPVLAAEQRKKAAQDAHVRAVEQWQKFAFLEGCERWLQRMAAFGAPRLEHHARPAPKTRDPMAEIQKLRAQLAELDAAWAAAESAPSPAADLHARFLSELDTIAAKGAPTFHATARNGSPVDLAALTRITQMPVPGPGEGPSLALVGDAGASFFVWLMKDEIAKRIGAMIEDVPQGGAMTDDEREARFADINKRRLEIERLEEALIVAAEREGRIVRRRHDCDPRALLEVAEV